MPTPAASPTSEFTGIELIVAIGQNADAVVLEVLQGSADLRQELKDMDVRVVLWPSEFPREPGIYLFSGTSSTGMPDLLQDDEAQALQETFHRCGHGKLEYTVKLPNDCVAGSPLLSSKQAAATTKYSLMSLRGGCRQR